MKQEKITLEEGIKKEWLITNGIGGYASSTIVGANTRKYHGLLVAPLAPPAKRHLILSKIDESIAIDENSYSLYTNLCKDYVGVGYKNQESFEKEYIPTFTYKVKNTQISKQICMQYGKNTVCVVYKVKNGKSNSKLTLAPIVNFRDFHSMSTNVEFNLDQTIEDKKVKLIINGGTVYMNISEGTYTARYNDTFRNMYYPEEDKRGFYPEENHAVAGVYEIEILPNEEKTITFVCSLEEKIEKIDGDKVIQSEIKRLDEIVKNTGAIVSRSRTFEENHYKKRNRTR